MKKIGFASINITDGFWKKKQDMVKNTTSYAVYNRFKETHRFDALKCVPSKEYEPHIFWDSDIAKWLEGVSYILRKNDAPELKKLACEAISDIIENCDESGYFNSYFLVKDKDKRFKNRDNHELYCLGHLIEASIAYLDATGDERFFKAMCKYAKYVKKVFKDEKSADFITPGHPELELALVKLYEKSGDKDFLELAKYFIDEHGKNHCNERKTFESNGFTALFNQDEMLLKDREKISGHSVRALYLFSGACDIARLYDDKELKDSCKRIFDNIINKRMYITGGVGSTRYGEAFTVDYNLPNRSAYNETCAAIALVYFASRMQEIDLNSKYADCIERVIYNGFLSGISLDGKSFFYENPLEIDLYLNDVHRATNHNDYFPITQRKEVFDCSCCPPNIVRFIPSIADYMYTYDDDKFYVHQYISSETQHEGMSITQKTNYPADSKIELAFNIQGKKLALRIPCWCKKFEINRKYTMKNGYAIIDEPCDSVAIDLKMSVVPVRANPRVHENAGRVAITRGPVVYCAEGIDNGNDIKSVSIDINAEFDIRDSEFLLPTLHTTAKKPISTEALYTEADDSFEKIPLTLIPYYAFANRGESDMCIWLLESK